MLRHVQGGAFRYTIRLNRKSWVLLFDNILSSHFMNIAYLRVSYHVVNVMDIHESENYIRHQVSPKPVADIT